METVIRRAVIVAVALFALLVSYKWGEADGRQQGRVEQMRVTDDVARIYTSSQRGE